MTASMLEYLSPNRLADALAGLGKRLHDSGHLVIFITKRNWLTRPLIGRWWQSNVYSKGELTDALRHAGFSRTAFLPFPLAARYLAAWGYRGAQIASCPK